MLAVIGGFQQKVSLAVCGSFPPPDVAPRRRRTQWTHLRQAWMPSRARRLASQMCAQLLAMARGALLDRLSLSLSLMLSLSFSLSLVLSVSLSLFRGTPRPMVGMRMDSNPCIARLCGACKARAQHDRWTALKSPVRDAKVKL